MNPKIFIRSKTDADVIAITDVTVAAFNTLGRSAITPSSSLSRHYLPPQDIFFVLSFDGHTPQGTVAFHEGFKADGQHKGEGEDL